MFSNYHKMHDSEQLPCVLWFYLCATSEKEERFSLVAHRVRRKVHRAELSQSFASASFSGVGF
jgi:hypothetical protein